MIPRLVICLLAAALFAAAPGAAMAADGAPAAADAPPTAAEGTAKAPQTSVAELEDEVMCPVCGTLLGLSQAPQADRQRVLIQRLIDQGLSKEEIKDRLVAEYGRGVLALPESSGFSLTAYLVPIIGLTLAAILLFFAVRRWRRETGGDGGQDSRGGGRDGEPGGQDGRGLSEDEANRLDSDFARYDL